MAIFSQHIVCKKDKYSWMLQPGCRQIEGFMWHKIAHSLRLFERKPTAELNVPNPTYSYSYICISMIGYTTSSAGSFPVL